LPCPNSQLVVQMQQAHQTPSCSTIDATEEITAEEVISGPIITIIVTVVTITVIEDEANIEQTIEEVIEEITTKIDLITIPIITITMLG